MCEGGMRLRIRLVRPVDHRLAAFAWPSGIFASLSLAIVGFPRPTRDAKAPVRCHIGVTDSIRAGLNARLVSRS